MYNTITRSWQINLSKPGYYEQSEETTDIVIEDTDYENYVEIPIEKRPFLVELPANDDVSEFGTLYDSVQDYFAEDAVTDPANFQQIVVIQLSRCYDVLLAILNESNPAVATQIATAHESGIFAGPDPAYDSGQPE